MLRKMMRRSLKTSRLRGRRMGRMTEKEAPRNSGSDLGRIRCTRSTALTLSA
jgi:hypothetical protein